MPPVRFADVLTAVDLPRATEHALADLLARKGGGVETGTGPRIEALDSWIASTLEAVDEMIAPLHGDGPPIGEIDALFHRLIGLDDLPGSQS